ncbi:MAG: aminopeptidase N [Rhodospirillaceae bacterium]|nr:aminopeptidase N [Rhodospirillales bacterium]
MPLDRADTEAAPQTIRRADYAPPVFWVDAVELAFDIGEAEVEVRADLKLRRNAPGPLELDGQELETRRVEIDGQPAQYRMDGERLIIDNVPDAFTLTTVVATDPTTNTALEGLYQSGGMLCTQCEAEGFRRITWYPDRPDVMARFRVTITADRARFPVLLSNGNLVDSADLGAGRHRAVWADPFPKPCYLFALVAGDLALVEGSFTTRSGREAALKFWVEHGNEDQVGHALESLRKAMEWDEQVFGLEYDLDIYNVVAVSHFNMGAMENKSLNIFNSKYVLAKQETATDGDFLGIESVIAHEYFHNWTGNRVTCRDWFQLTLKEGLTVFRDQEFSADMNSRGLQRIEDVRALRASQFPEDNGPMAHPIRPESYVEINNFYTSTVYEKGAEIIRMIHTLIGAESFRKGMDLYFARHDGSAVTCEDFVAAMETASGVDLAQFRRWYAQAGTPKITAAWTHDPATKRLTLTLSQATKPTPGQEEKLPFHIPVALGLVGKSGDVPLRLEGENAAHGTTRVLNLTEAQTSFVFEDVAEPAVPSLFRGFSAPVVVDAPYAEADLAFLMANDSDAFNRWDAGQELAIRVILELIRKFRAGEELTLDEGFAAAWGKVLADHATDPAFAAEALGWAGFSVLGERMEVIDVDGIYAATLFLAEAMGRRFYEPLKRVRNALTEPGYSLTPQAIGKRRLRNVALSFLAFTKTDEMLALTQEQFRTATCMTDQMAALGALTLFGADATQPALDAFFQQWQSEKLVVNKWLALQAMANWPDVLERVKALLVHPAFDASEPNKIYALIGGFAGNPKWVHALDGAGYEFVADRVIELDSTNPQVASRMVRSLMRWKRYDAARQALMKAQLERIAAKPGLSRDVGEIVAKALVL